MDIAWPVKRLSNRQLIVIPLVLAAVLGSAVALHWDSHETPVPLGMDFKGGSFIRIGSIQTPSQRQVKDFGVAFKDYLPPGASVDTRRVENGMHVETSEAILENQEISSTKGCIRDQISEMELGDDPSIQIDAMGSIITDLYKTRARDAAIAAVIAMAIILFIALRSFSVVGNILLVIALDFLGILGGMAIAEIELTRASMAGILLIFGYAVNTNILLSRNILKRKGGDDRERAARAMSTGVKMSSTSAAAMIALNLVTTAPELNQISAILVIGIFVDMVNTWFLNSGLILRKRRGAKEGYGARI